MSEIDQKLQEALKDVSTEKLREWLETMTASRADEVQYQGHAIDRRTLINIISNRTPAES